MVGLAPKSIIKRCAKLDLLWLSLAHSAKQRPSATCCQWPRRIYGCRRRMRDQIAIVVVVVLVAAAANWILAPEFAGYERRASRYKYYWHHQKPTNQLNRNQVLLLPLRCFISHLSVHSIICLARSLPLLFVHSSFWLAFSLLTWWASWGYFPWMEEIEDR